MLDLRGWHGAIAEAARPGGSGHGPAPAPGLGEVSSGSPTCQWKLSKQLIKELAVGVRNWLVKTPNASALV